MIIKALKQTKGLFEPDYEISSADMSSVRYRHMRDIDSCRIKTLTVPRGMGVWVSQLRKRFLFALP